MSKKLLFLALYITMLAGFANAAVLYEKSFAELGYGDFIVSIVPGDGNAIEECRNFVFSLPQSVDVSDGNFYVVFSLFVKFEPVQRDKFADVNVFLNGGHAGRFFTADFRCNDSNCVKRILLQKELLEEENTLEICPKTSEGISEITLMKESMVGIYKMPYFRQGDFIKETSSYTPMLGEELTISISLYNSGSEPAEVTINHIKPLIEEKLKVTVFNVLRGESEWQGIIGPGEKKTIRYVVKPTKALPMTLLAASATYTNVFGEEETIISNYPQIDVREPEIRVYILKEEGTNLAGETVEMKLAVKNNVKQPLQDIAVKLDAPSGIEVVSMPEGMIGEIQGQETVYLPFSVRAAEEGTYAFSCSAEYKIDENTFKVLCEDTEIEFTRGGIDPIILVGIIFIFIGAGIYLYLHFSK